MNENDFYHLTNTEKQNKSLRFALIFSIAMNALFLLIILCIDKKGDTKNKVEPTDNVPIIVNGKPENDLAKSIYTSLNVTIKDLHDITKVIHGHEEMLERIVSGHNKGVLYRAPTSKENMPLWDETYAKLEKQAKIYNDLVKHYNELMAQSSWKFEDEDLPKVVRFYSLPVAPTWKK